MHEFCHLAEFNHTKWFFALLDRTFPKWRDVMERLERLLVWPTKLPRRWADGHSGLRDGGGYVAVVSYERSA